MITYRRYIEILSAQGVPEGHSFLTNLIYNKAEEDITESLSERLGKLLKEIEEENYSPATLNDFAKTHLGIEGPVLKKRDFSRWKRDN